MRGSSIEQPWVVGNDVGIGPPGPNPQNGGDQPDSSLPTHMIWGKASHFTDILSPRGTCNLSCTEVRDEFPQLGATEPYDSY